MVQKGQICLQAAMKVATVSLVVIFAISCNADLSFVTTDSSNNAAVTKKLNKVNSVISALVNPSFVKKTTQAIASQDSTIKTLIIAIYNIPVMGFGCLSASGMKILSNLETGATTPANISDAFAAACPLWKSKVNDVVNAAAAFKAKYSNQSPEIVSNLPASIQSALSTLNNFTTSILSNGASFKNDTFLKGSLNSLVEKVQAVVPKDWKKLSSSVPWLGPVVNKKGNLNSNFNNALNLVKDGIENGFNTTALADELTPLSTGVSSNLPAISTWIYKKVDALPIDSTTASDPTVTAVGDTLSKYVSLYVPKLVSSSDVQNSLKTLISGNYKFKG